MARKIVINLPDSEMSQSVLKGLNRRLSMMEDSVKKKKKKSEFSEFKRELQKERQWNHAMADRKIKNMEKTTNSIASALSSLGKIRLPSPS